MEWVLRSPQIHSTFSNLGYVHPDGYHVNENCNSALESILHNILSEDKYLRTYRKSISFGQNIQKDLIPLLINAKEYKTIELLTKVLVNLTIPVECLLSVEVLSKNYFGRHTIFEINNLLASTKNAFTDFRATKVIVDFLKKNLDVEQSEEQRLNISNCLLLLRNILHIPESNNIQTPNYNESSHTVQNQIIWNIFSQSIDKILVKLMTVPDACHWGVTMVQLISLLYKDQQVVVLQKLLNLWIESSLSESSEDNESNTSSSDRGSADSSLVLTSDPTSDSSDASRNGVSNSVNNAWESSADNINSNNSDQSFEKTADLGGQQAEELNNEDFIENNTDDSMKHNGTAPSSTSGVQSQDSQQSEQGDADQNTNIKKSAVTESSDCGYGTQIENRESVSTSSNEDDLPSKKPVHQKRHNPKQKPNTKVRTGTTSFQDRKRKKIIKRGKSNIVNVQGLTHRTPTDDDISNVLKEFTVDFLLKGYNSLVKTLHYEILTNINLEIDTSHFFWLLTYFLKFATQIELDLQHVGSVLSYDIVSYLTAEGVNLCEHFELAIKLDGNDLAPCLRRLHLVVTAIREFVQAINEYKKKAHLNNSDQEELLKLQIKMCETDELRSLLVLLLRHYNPKYNSKQYLQDLIVTNHILLLFMDSIMKFPEYTGTGNMIDHVKQFASREIMHTYGLLLEDYSINGEFVNDCIFTIMHHVGGDLGCLNTLFQPRLLKTFTGIWKSEFELCDDWNDLILYVINTFVKKPHSFERMPDLGTECFEDDILSKFVASETGEVNETEMKMGVDGSKESTSLYEGWTADEISSLRWTYLQCNTLADCVGDISKKLKEDGIIKSRESIIKELFKQNILNKNEFDKMIKGESHRGVKKNHSKKEVRDEEIPKLCQQLACDGKTEFLDWVQKVLLDTCHAKIYIEKRKADESQIKKSKLLSFELFKRKGEEMPVISPVSYHSLVLDQSVPLVPWNCQQADVCKDLKFLQLLHKLGFGMPVDTGKVFIRIPHFWSADFMYNIAGKISPIHTSKLKFTVNEFAQTSAAKPGPEHCMSSEMHKDTVLPEPQYIYQVHRHLATMVNFTPKPGCSYNCDGGVIDSDNWLKVVQKSQEFKLTIKLESHSTVVEHKHTTVARPACEPTQNTCEPDTEPLIPTDLSHTDKISTFDEPMDDNEACNISLSDTASVASDLTRMYVSDEDEKPEELASKRLLRPPLNHSQPDLDDPLIPRQGKRPRVEFATPY